jgi:hypothetical protein
LRPSGFHYSFMLLPPPRPRYTVCRNIYLGRTTFNYGAARIPKRVAI